MRTPRPSLSVPRRTIVVLAVGLLAAGCFGSGDDSADIEVLPSSAVTEAVDGDADDPAGADSDDSTGPVATDREDTSAEDPPGDDAPVTAASASAPDASLAVDGAGHPFCVEYVSSDAMFDDLNFFDPAQLEDGMAQLNDLLDRAIPDAPVEIAGDLAVVQANFQAVDAVMAEAGYDMLSATDALLEELDQVAESPEADVSSARIDAWVTANCDAQIAEGAAVGDGTDDDLAAIFGSAGGAALAMDALRGGQSLTPAQVQCLVSSFDEELMGELLSSATDAADDQTAARLAELFTDCGVSPDVFG